MTLAVLAVQNSSLVRNSPKKSLPLPITLDYDNHGSAETSWISDSHSEQLDAENLMLAPASCTNDQRNTSSLITPKMVSPVITNRFSHNPYMIRHVITDIGSRVKGVEARHQKERQEHCALPRPIAPDNIDNLVEVVTPVAGPAVMCCYYKQRGTCKMGTACWHGHEGHASTPCHYGSKCKAGHAHLSNGAAGPKPAATPAPPKSAPRSAGGQAPTSSSTTVDPLAVCRLCNATSLYLQVIPVYNGDRMERATRAMCPTCKGAFLM
ncbi:Hypothetical protein, putative [Bodo saltans]|uniref:C3H1-type domain-containing protein n=1 Tax=Bodo saltans TaxID=75058 RepID=A0A0S4IVR3_BODSA|nr:Hypothetical protein, putative [Bodo saltans]|eukprot:CUF92361.1 Hypothetical protein, putative [Bodo saltans]